MRAPFLPRQKEAMRRMRVWSPDNNAKILLAEQESQQGPNSIASLEGLYQLPSCLLVSDGRNQVSQMCSSNETYQKNEGRLLLRY